MDPQENTQLVLGIYEAFGRGDLAKIIESLAEDVEWVQPAGEHLPWGGVKRGRAEVGEFFRVLKETVDYQELNAREVLAQDNRVIVLGESIAAVRANRRIVEQAWVMAWTVEGGAVKHYQYFDDTAKWVAALKSEGETA